MSLLNLWSLFKSCSSTSVCSLSLMDKIIVLAPPTKRKHPAPPPVLQQTSPAHFPRNERLVLLYNKAKGRHLTIICSKQAQQTSSSYTTLKQSEKNVRKKPKLESQHYTSIHPAPPPCSLAAKKHSTLPKQRASPTTLEQSQKKKLELLSFILVLLL